jgi:hypothetical protein
MTEPVDVRRVDQDQINKFSALNRRLQEIEADSAGLKVCVVWSRVIMIRRCGCVFVCVCVRVCYVCALVAPHARPICRPACRSCGPSCPARPATLPPPPSATVLPSPSYAQT